MSDAPPRLGMLYPGHSAEDDYPRLGAMTGAEVRVVHTSMDEDAHRVDALLELGSHARMRAGAAELADFRPHAAMWACTSGSFVFGWEGARAQAAVVSEALGCPASSTSIAFADALAALGLRKVAIAATYPADVAESFRAFLQHGGVEVVSVGSQNIITAAEVGTFNEERVLTIVRSGDHPEAEAVLVPDTALHTAGWIRAMEDTARKPVLTANQVTIWQALRLAERLEPVAELGTLFAA